MEPKLCKTCNERPRKPARAYCSECDRARQRVNYRKRLGWSEEQIIEREVEFRVREIRAEQRRSEVESRITQALRNDPIYPDNGVDRVYGVPEDPEHLRGLREAGLLPPE